VTVVFEWGWLGDALHVDKTGPIISFMPIILMGVLFGLAMDYEVFLVSRIREDFVHGGDARRAIQSGFVSSAKVVTAAAVIMISVFAAFVPEGDASIKPIALGLAVGVFVDAFIVRMTLVPAILQLLDAPLARPHPPLVRCGGRRTAEGARARELARGRRPDRGGRGRAGRQHAEPAAGR
jgi:RND superfamily putative drug exporter